MFVGSVPYYIAAILFLAIFAYEANILPTGGRIPKGVSPGLTAPFVFGAMYHATLPIMSLVLTSLSSLEMRGNAIQVLGSDYLRVARLRGLGDRRITTRYIIRNAILPMYTNILRSIATVFSGSVILETVFSYPGVGWYIFKSFQTRDYPLMMGGFLLTTTAIVIGLTIADLSYGLIDPRIKTGEAEEVF
jgi:peptide/nickel transport system permease protein